MHLTRNEVELLCGAVCPGAAQSKCAFKQGEVIGFIDTSAGHDGSKGIAFSADEMTIKTNGSVRRILYSDISSVVIVESYESSFADELVISVQRSEIRISDYSLDKSELKKLIDGLCESGVSAGEKAASLQDEEQLPEAVSERSAEEKQKETSESTEIVPNEINNGVFEVGSENDFQYAFTDWANEQVFSGVIPEEELPKETDGGVFTLARENASLDFSENHVFSEVISEDITREYKAQTREIYPSKNDEEVFDKASESGLSDESADSFQEEFHNIQEFPGVIPEEAPEWEDTPASVYEEDTAVRTVTKAETNQEEATVLETANNGGNTAKTDDDFDEQAELERISSMSHEQTMSYLADAFAEINGAKDEDSKKSSNKAPIENAAEQAIQVVETGTSEIKNTEAKNPLKEASREELTIEPAWGDIYIKASRSLRELCEQGKLSMDAIREELRVRLLPSAKAFAEITADESRIPKVLMPRITELRSAAKNFDEYFSYGDDIGTRAMFFMLFQMLSYADRIVENHEAKERLNDFFRRFGSAGIILSMLDMRV